MSDNWVVQNLDNALSTWNGYLSEIWNLITTTPQNFRGGAIWSVIQNVNTAVQGVGLGLLVLFFVVGMVKTCGSFADVKKPEHALKLFVRFILAKAVITQGMELMLTIFTIIQGVINTIITSSGITNPNNLALPDDIVSAIEEGLAPEVIAEKCGLAGLVEYMEACGCEALILGCTHFPYLRAEFDRLCKIPVIDPADEMFTAMTGLK